MRVALSKFTIANVKAIKRMEPKVQELFLEFLWRIAMEGIYVRITSTMRTSDEQDEEKRKGNSTVGDHDSYHTWGLAMDIAPLTRIGPIYYKTWFSSKAFERITEVARTLGIEWPHEDGTAETDFVAWRKLGFSDQPHYQYAGGVSIAQLKNQMHFEQPTFVPSWKPTVLQRAIRRALSRV